MKKIIFLMILVLTFLSFKVVSNASQVPLENNARIGTSNFLFIDMAAGIEYYQKRFYVYSEEFEQYSFTKLSELFNFVNGNASMQPIIYWHDRTRIELGINIDNQNQYGYYDDVVMIVVTKKEFPVVEMQLIRSNNTSVKLINNQMPSPDIVLYKQINTLADPYQNGFNQGVQSGISQGILQGETIGYDKGYVQGRLDYGIFYQNNWLNALSWGNIRYNQGLSDNDLNIFDMVTNGIFSAVGLVFGIQIFPNFTLGMFAMIGLVFGVLGFILLRSKGKGGK